MYCIRESIFRTSITETVNSETPNNTHIIVVDYIRFHNRIPPYNMYQLFDAY